MLCFEKKKIHLEFKSSSLQETKYELNDLLIIENFESRKISGGNNSVEV